MCVYVCVCVCVCWAEQPFPTQNRALFLGALQFISLSKHVLTPSVKLSLGGSIFYKPCDIMIRTLSVKLINFIYHRPLNINNHQCLAGVYKAVFVIMCAFKENKVYPNCYKGFNQCSSYTEITSKIRHACGDYGDAKECEVKEAAMKLMRPLTDEEQQIVDSAIHGIGPVAEILVRQDADSVQRGSMQTLQPNTWLNDEIVNYFLKNCLAKRDEKLCAEQPGRKRSHFFNSFFVQTMFDEKNLNPSLRGKYNYKNVKRWGKKVPGKDIFNLRYIVCPINLDNMHWTSAVIFMELKKIQYFDSMGGTDRSKLEGLLQYLKDEHKAKKGTELDVSEWELVPCTMDTPRQRNGKCWDVVYNLFI